MRRNSTGIRDISFGQKLGQAIDRLDKMITSAATKCIQQLKDAPGE